MFSKLTKVFRAVICATLCFVLILSVIACNQNNPPQSSSSESSVTQPNDSSTPDTPDNPTPPDNPDGPDTPVVPVVTPKLSQITVSDGYGVEFNAETSEYTVNIPDGRPSVPMVSAVAEEGATAKVYQAFFPDGVKTAYAQIEVVKNGVTGIYKVNFVKDSSLGFVLQYDDRYDFASTLTDKQVTYFSSNPAVIEVSESGIVHTKELSSTPVTITASKDGTVVKTLTVDTVIPAPINVFFITGQSNAAGTYDPGPSYESEVAKSTRPKLGTAYCIEVVSNGYRYPIYDLNKGREGFSPALASKWYELSGEKVLVVQTAVGGSPIEAWIKDGDYYLGGRLYNNTLNAYNYVKDTYGQQNSPFSIERFGYFWCQGETGQWYDWNGSAWVDGTPTTAQEYYDIFTENHANYLADMNVEFGSIALVRALASRSSAQSKLMGTFTDLVEPRVAQYVMHNDANGTIFIGSRIGDIARNTNTLDKASEGYAYMGSESLHYSQIGYNAQGAELAINTFARYSPTTNHTPVSLEVLSSNGRTRLYEGNTVIVDRTRGHQFAALTLPIHTTDTVNFAITEGTNVCAVNNLGLVTFNQGAKTGTTAILTVTSSSGLSVNINLILGDVDYDYINAKQTTLRWDFNDLNETNGLSVLALSARSNSNSYFLNRGYITKYDSKSDFAMQRPIMLTHDSDWSIEWRGVAQTASCLFGREYSNNDFLFLAYDNSSFGNALYMVDSNGKVAQIPYGNYANKNTVLNTWKLSYNASTKIMSFQVANGSSWSLVGSYTWESEFQFLFTNMFGRYGTSSFHSCYSGQIDYVEVHAKTFD